MYSRQATHSEVDEADIPSIPPSIDLSDPHQLHRTILQVILSILCPAMAGAAISGIVFSLTYRKAVPWKTISYAITLKEHSEIAMLDFKFVDAFLGDLIIYIVVTVVAVLAIILMLGFVSAALHKARGLKLFTVSIATIVVLFMIVTCLLLGFRMKLRERVEDFGRLSLRFGFTGSSDGPADHAPGATTTYVWQWIQVKHECCGWKNGEDYLQATSWNRSIMVFNLSEYSLMRANQMLNLPNRVVVITEPQNNTGVGLGKLELIALKQILPPSCCQLDNRSQTSNLDVKTSYLPKNFSKLVLEDKTCPYTGISSYSGTGCYELLTTFVNRGLVIAGIVEGVALLLSLLTGIMAWRLAKYPTAMEVEAELDKIRGGANAAISSSNTNISPRQQGGPGLFSRTPSYTYTPSILLYQQDSSLDNRASFVTAPPQVTGPYPQDLYRNSTTTIPKRRSPRRRRARRGRIRRGGRNRRRRR